MKLETIGKPVGKIPVRFNYRFLELFSEGLYSSPNKAFEELVSNSFDALAKKVAVYVPPDIASKDAVMWVCDNGISMDSIGLHLLWAIGSSHKRSSSYIIDDDRPPIGKFGIGKLATFSLCRKLTYICKIENIYRAVTMDYGRVNKDSYDPISLDERILSESEVKEALFPLIQKDKRGLVSFEMWGQQAERTWTFAAMSDLTPNANQIKEGRLKWVLRTALPLNPDFNLWFNGIKLEPSKIKLAPLKEWTIGLEDNVAEKLNYKESEINGNPCINMAYLQNVHGEIELFRELLTTGKSEEFGRSNGFFVMVRNRLINLDDPLFGMAALSHGTFARFRMIIHADGLDEYLRSTRESIMESPALDELKRYMKMKFEEVRAYYISVLTKEERESRAAYKISQTPSSLSRRPLLAVARKFFDGEIESLILTDLPLNIDSKAKESFLELLEEDLISETGIIKEVSWEALPPEDPVARLDLSARKVRINLLHPFFANFMEEVKSTLPFQLVAITEVLLEAYLIEIGIHQDHVRDIVWRRDELLRELTLRDKPNAPLVAQLIQAKLSDPSGLEDAAFEAFRSLGFETTKIGGPGKPDGKAVAILGVRDTKTGKRDDYSVVYDAKSTKEKKIKAATARISAVKRHQKDFNADYTVVIAIDFEGGDDPFSAVSKESKENKVTMIRASDLIKLILVASPKQLGFDDFKELFETCYSPIETSEWV